MKVPRRGLLMLSAFALGACAGRPLPTTLPADHPANPDFPLPPPRTVATTLGADDLGPAFPPGPQATPVPSPAPSTGHGHDRHEAASYRCPMHPEVVKPDPGSCPRCGMRLVAEEAR